VTPLRHSAISQADHAGEVVWGESASHSRKVLSVYLFDSGLDFFGSGTALLRIYPAPPPTWNRAELV
jgi:hypothetical protein